MSSASDRPGTVYTFYSYKGGVGRSMAMANVAALLARWGQRVLMVDWDLEAPGIEKFFAPWISVKPKPVQGVLDLIESHADGGGADWRKFLIRFEPQGCKELHILAAGRDHDLPAGEGEYTKRLRKIDWEVQFEEKRLGNYLERLRDEWRNEYDFVLIDSRTGITDIGGICTIHLPDVLVCFFTANEQSIEGVKDVMTRARLGHSRLPVDRLRLLVVPVPARDESGSEYELADEWRGRFADALGEFFKDWVPEDEKAKRVLDFLKIPYFAYWSFGERVPVLEESDPENPKTLAYAYQPLARLLLTRLDWSEARAGTRSTELSRQHEAEAEKARLEARLLDEQQTQRREARVAATQFIDDRVQSIIDKLQYEVIAKRITGGAMVATGALFAIVFLVAVAMLAFESLTTDNLFQTQSYVLGAIAAAAGLLVVLTAVIWRISRFDLKVKIAGAGARELERLTSIFQSQMTSDDVATHFEQYVKMVEAEIAATGWALDHPRAAYRQGTAPDQPTTKRDTQSTKITD